MYLKRGDAGEIVICWRRFGLVLAGIAIGVLVPTAIGLYFGRRPSHIAQFVVPIVWVGGAQFVVLHFLKRRAEGKSPWQFSLLAVFVAMTAICVLLTLVVLDRRANLEQHAARQALEKELNAGINGAGKISVGQQTTIVASLPSFGDGELRSMLSRHKQDALANSDITFLVLNGTSLTDEGVKLLADTRTLEYCFLSQTQITDESIDILEKLPNLRILQVQSTMVTPERLLKLSRARPKLNIEPKTYQKLKTLNVSK
jgi:hypothetical protein